MESNQTKNGKTAHRGNLGQATVRELITQLALAEDEHRSAVDPDKIAGLARREHDILAALHQHKSASNSTINLKPTPQWTILGTVEGSSGEL